MNHHPGKPEVVAAGAGWRSLMRAGDLIGQQLRVYLPVILIWGGIALLASVVYAGMLVYLFSLPLLQAGAMRMFDQQLQRARLNPRQMFAMFRDAQRGQLLLAMLWVFLFAAAGMIVVTLSFGDLLRTLAAIQTPPELLQTDWPADQVFGLLASLLALLTVVALLWFFAVPRIAFDLMPAGPALRESLLVCLRNWRALLTYGLAQVVVILAGFVMVGLLGSMAAVLGTSGQLAFNFLLSNLFAAALQVLNAGGQYLLWRQVFQSAEPSRHHGRTPGRLVA